MSKNGKTVLCLILVAVLMMFSLLTGCGTTEGKKGELDQTTAQAQTAPTAVPTEQPKEKVKITFWHTYGDSEEPFFNDNILPLFKEKFPYIEVESLRQESGQYNQLIVTALGTKQTPDVARIDLTNVATYANQGGLLSLDDMEGFKEIAGQCLEGPLATNYFKSKYYGLPLDTNCKAAVMNMNVMKKLGFTEPPKTMEEIIEASTKNSAGKYTINVSGTGDWDSYTYFWLFGGVLTDGKFSKAAGYMDSPQSIAALQKMIDLHNEKVFTVRDIDGTPDAWDGIKKDEYALFFEGPWYFSCNPDYKDKNIVPAAIPTYNGKSSSIVGGEDIVIFKNSKHPEEAFEFVKFMLSDEVQTLMASKGQMPVLKTSVNKEQIKKDSVLSVYQKQLETANTRIPSPQNSLISQYWGEEITKALKGEVTAEAALKSAAQKIDAELAK